MTLFWILDVSALIASGVAGWLLRSAIYARAEFRRQLAAWDAERGIGSSRG